MRVLIAVAETAARRRLEDFFERRRDEVAACGEPCRAAALDLGGFQVALIDLEPDRTGAIELCREVRRRSAGALVLVAARAESPQTVRAALDAGADDYVVKPIDPAALQLRLEIGRRHRSAQRSAGEVEAALQRERALFQQLFHNSPAGIVILDEADRVVDANRAFVDLFRYESGELTGRSLAAMIVPDELRDEAAQLSDLVSGRRTVSHETVRRRKDGSSVDVSILGYPIELAAGRTGAFGLYTDITERKRAERKLFHDAFHDPLTGLPNRTLLTERLERDLRRVKQRGDYRFALLFVDLDRFKEVNDTLGHAAGDELLVEAARRLERCLRPGDTTARLAGDEFTIVLEDVHEVADIIHIAERVLEVLRRPFEIAGQETQISGSLGLVVSSAAYASAEELIRDADIAMYRAKRRGKACYEIFDPEMQRGAEERSRLEADVARAVKEDQQELHYQPIVSLSTGRVVAFEALVRWRHPERGLLGPDELVPVCEATGLIQPLGRWILRRACRQVVAWQRGSERPGLRVTVNVSSGQLTSPDFLPELDDVVAETGVEPDSIALELKEQALVDAEGSIALLWKLRRRGLHLYLDDFGTGYTSLRELYRSPIEALKIDRSFIARMKPGGADVEAVRAAAAFAAGLGLEVVAEGIETAHQLKLARELGATHAQGYFFSHPLPADEATALIDDNPQW